LSITILPSLFYSKFSILFFAPDSFFCNLISESIDSALNLLISYSCITYAFLLEQHEKQGNSFDIINNTEGLLLLPN